MQTGEHHHGKWKPWAVPAILSLLMVVLQVFGNEVSQWLRYNHDAVAAGQLWRLLSAHFVHLGWSHLLLNLAGLLLTWALVGEALRSRGWLLLLLITGLASTLALWQFNPELQWYVGLSGVLHGVMLCGALLLFSRGDRGAAVLALMVLGKLLWEQFAGPLPGSEEASGGAVIVDAHLYGAISGGVFALSTIALRALR